MGFARFMSSITGRAVRVVAGLALIVVAFATGAWIVAVIGLVPLAAGALDVCLFAPLFKAPFSGKAVRAGR